MGIDSLILECEERASAGQKVREIAERLAVSEKVVSSVLDEAELLENHPADDPDEV